MLDGHGQVQLVDMRYAVQAHGSHSARTLHAMRARFSLCPVHTLLQVKADPPPTDFCGYAHYLAPEQVTAQGHGLPTDLWALGILTYEMICSGGNPWLTGDAAQDSEVGVYSRISAHRAGALTFPDGVSVSAPLAALLNKLLHPSPAGRLGCAHGPKELRDAEWFGGFQFAELEAGEMKAPHAKAAADAVAAALQKKRSPCL
jgi:serine/threonine protein kinase